MNLRIAVHVETSSTTSNGTCRRRDATATFRMCHHLSARRVQHRETPLLCMQTSVDEKNIVMVEVNRDERCTHRHQGIADHCCGKSVAGSWNATPQVYGRHESQQRRKQQLVATFAEDEMNNHSVSPLLAEPTVLDT